MTEWTLEKVLAERHWSKEKVMTVPPELIRAAFNTRSNRTDCKVVVLCLERIAQRSYHGVDEETLVVMYNFISHFTDGE
jgi:hypothetical protein